jgi:hypothetical protein
MSKHLIIMLMAFLSVIIIMSCNKSTPSTPAVPQAKCIVKSSTSYLAGNYGHTEYEFDNTGKPTLIKGYRPNGSIASEYELGFTSAVYYTHDARGKLPLSIMKFSSDIFTGLPSKVNISQWDGDTLRVNIRTYFFFYNSKDQIIKVGQQTDHVVGDWEYDVNIYYNEQGNVKALQYEWTTGPREVIPPITVTAYDDKPTPYAGFKGWRFLCNWDNPDAEPILTALSKNNPLDYTRNTGASTFKREMVYQYNTEGFPTERKNTNKNVNGEYTFSQTYTYTCN